VAARCSTFYTRLLERRTTWSSAQCAVPGSVKARVLPPGPSRGGAPGAAGIAVHLQKMTPRSTQCASVASVFCGQVAGSTRNPPEGGVRHNNQLIHFSLQTSELIRGGNSQWTRLEPPALPHIWRKGTLEDPSGLSDVGWRLCRGRQCKDLY
jgi:hypothetical protein